MELRSNWNERDSLVANRTELTNGNQTTTGKPMAVGTEDDAVLKGVRATLTLGQDVMRIAWAFIPATIHTGLREHLAQNLFLGRGPESVRFGDEVASSFIPGTGMGLRSRQSTSLGLTLSVGFAPAMMTSKVAPPWFDGKSAPACTEHKDSRERTTPEIFGVGVNFSLSSIPNTGSKEQLGIC